VIGDDSMAMAEGEEGGEIRQEDHDHERGRAREHALEQPHEGGMHAAAEVELARALERGDDASSAVILAKNSSSKSGSGEPRNPCPSELPK
jgi:hypothetical protein